MNFWRETPDGVTVMVKAHPGARKPGLMGFRDSAAGPRLRIAVTEAAEDGKANRAICAALARAIKVPVASVRVLTGASQREKTLAVSGAPVTLIETLRAL